MWLTAADKREDEHGTRPDRPRPDGCQHVAALAACRPRRRGLRTHTPRRSRASSRTVRSRPAPPRSRTSCRGCPSATDGLADGARRGRRCDPRRAGPAARIRRHGGRRRELVLPRRSPPLEGAGRPRHRLRRLSGSAAVSPVLERGYCLMIGGPDAAVRRLDPLFGAWRPASRLHLELPAADGPPAKAERGYLHCGPSGAGHFVKMVHNGIEYGLMAAYAEGLNILKHADAGLRAARPSTPRRRPSATPSSTSTSSTWGTSPRSGDGAASSPRGSST